MKLISDYLKRAVISILPVVAAASIQANEKISHVYENKTKDIIARVIVGEGRNCNWEEQVAIGYTLINRLNDPKKRYGKDLLEIASTQYCSFKPGNPNREVVDSPSIYAPKSYQQALRIADNILSGDYLDITNGATHFHTPAAKPSWRTGSSMKRIGRVKTSQGPTRHIFYRER